MAKIQEENKMTRKNSEVAINSRVLHLHVIKNNPNFTLSGQKAKECRETERDSTQKMRENVRYDLKIPCIISSHSIP